MKQLIIFILAASAAISVIQTVEAQTAPGKQWDKTFGGNGIDHLYAGQQTSDGGYIVGGGSNSGAGGDKSQSLVGGNSDYWILKMDASGNKQWDRAFGSIDGEGIWSIKQTTDGGYIIGGTNENIGISGDKTQPGFGFDDYWIVKIDASGNKQWDKTFGGTDFDQFRSLSLTSDGGYILLGHSRSGVSGDKSHPNKGFVTTSDLWVIKIDSNGIKQWDKTIGGSGNEFANEIIATSDGGAFVSGYSNSGISGNKSQASRGLFDYWVLKLNSVGSVVWDKTYGGSGSDFLWRGKQTSDGGYIIGGYTDSGANGDKSQPSKGLEDLWVLKLDSNGNKIWDKTIGTSSADYFSDVVEDPSGGFLVAASTDGGINGDKSHASKGWADYWVLKLDSNGSKLWDIAYGGSESDWPRDIYIEPNGDFLIAGESMSGISDDKSQSCLGVSDHWVIKVGSSLTGIDQALKPTLTLYPNPTTGLINLELKDQQPTQISVYNSLGQTILTKSEAQPNPDGKLQLDLSKQAKGIYTVQVISGNRSAVKKVVLQ